jgi:hypothetical protein
MNIDHRGWRGRQMTNDKQWAQHPPPSPANNCSQGGSRVPDDRNNVPMTTHHHRYQRQQPRRQRGPTTQLHRCEQLLAGWARDGAMTGLGKLHSNIFGNDNMILIPSRTPEKNKSTQSCGVGLASMWLVMKSSMCINFRGRSILIN